MGDSSGNNSSLNIDELIACPNCDTLSRKIHLQTGQKAVCACCGSKLFSHRKDAINRTLAVSIAGLIVVVPAMTLPLIGVGLVGRFNEASLVECIADLVSNDFPIIALCLFLFTIATPIVRLITAFYITYSIKINKVTPHLLQFFRSYHTLDNWVMLHVFLLGLIVSMYKLVSMADLTVGIGFGAFILLQLCSTLVSVTLDQHAIWEILERANDNNE